MAVSFVSTGSFAGATTGITVTLPAGVTSGDLCLLLIETACETVSTPSGWNIVPGAPVTTSGSAGSLGGTRLSIFYRFFVSGDGSVVIGDTGNHQLGVMLAFRGVDTSVPFDPVNGVGSVDETSAGTLSASGITTSAVNRFVLLCGANPLDSNDDLFFSVSNGSVSGSMLFNSSSGTGNGGGIGVWGALWAGSGSTGAFSCSWDEGGFGMIFEKQVAFALGLVAIGEGGGGGGGGGSSAGSFFPFFID
jgi:hypothetical protein